MRRAASSGLTGSSARRPGRRRGSRARGTAAGGRSRSLAYDDSTRARKIDRTSVRARNAPRASASATGAGLEAIQGRKSACTRAMTTICLVWWARCRQKSPGPECSSSIPSWSIVSSRCVSGLSTGIRPVSARSSISMAKSARMSGAPSGPAASRGLGREGSEVGRPGRHGDREDDQHQHRLDERRDGHLARRAHAAERAAGVERADGGEEPREREPARGGGSRRRAGAARPRRPREARRGPARAPPPSTSRPGRGRGTARKKEPAVSAWTRPLAKELPEVAVGLEDPRAAPALQARLELLDDAGDERPEEEHEEGHLAEGEREVEGRRHLLPFPNDSSVHEEREEHVADVAVDPSRAAGPHRVRGGHHPELEPVGRDWSGRRRRRRPPSAVRRTKYGVGPVSLSTSRRGR